MTVGWQEVPGRTTLLHLVMLGVSELWEERSPAVLRFEGVKTQGLHSAAAVEPGWLKAVEFLPF